MTRVPGIDHPEEQGEADVTLTGRGISVNCRVELVTDDVISVRPSVGDYVQRAVVTVGDPVEVFWQGHEEQRMVPAEVVGAETGAVVRWRLRMTGEAEQSQRRKAVRARVALPVEVGYGSVEMRGETVDLSEAGIRAKVDGLGLAPEPGSTVDLRITVDDDVQVKTRAEVIRMQARGATWLLSLRLLDLEERDSDRLRRRVFQALREERARLAD